MKKKYLFIGPINLSNKPLGGAEAKNQLLIEKLKSIYNINFIDTSKSNLNFYTILKLMISILFYKRIILSISSKSLLTLSKLNFLLKNKTIIIFVIGGVVHKKMKDEKLLALFKNSKIVFAETKSLQENLQNISKKINVIHLPNFKKSLKTKPFKGIEFNKTEIKFYFLSRVSASKGIFKSIELVKYLNHKQFLGRKYTLDIYGPFELDDTEKLEFDKALEYASINYKGILDLSQDINYRILASYDFNLFLTNHKGEGFPGVLIDSMIAGVPIIASDWGYNKEILSNKHCIVDLDMGYISQIENYVHNIINLSSQERNMLKEEIYEESFLYDINKLDISF